MQPAVRGERDGHALATEAANCASPVVSVSRLVKRFRRIGGATAAAVDGVSFDVAPGEFLVLLGPSGCGKTTLLRTIAGLERADAGEVSIHGRICFSSEKQIHIPTERRNISMIFQSYALWPHMTIFDNVAYPLRNARPRLKSARIAEQVERVLTLVNISELSRQYPGQMSGGQQQRAALARALVAGCDLVLFDEPLSNVDAKVREQLRNEMLDMQRSFGFSGIYVTHDQHEAMGLADRIAVMREGKIAQLGPPRQIYGEPASRYVANFIGRANEIAGRVTAVDSTECAVDTPLGRLVGIPGQRDMTVGEEVVLVWRPEHGVISPDTSAASGPNVLDGEITTELFLGTHTERTVRVGDRNFLVWGLGSALVPSGAHVGLSIAPAQMRVLRKNDDDA
jgi:iron(III) transport system ATP-binding protein